MKAGYFLLSALLLFFGSKSLAQTQFIAIQSRSGDINQLNLEDKSDNFGLAPMRPHIIKKISKSCVEITKSNGMSTEVDTVCDDRVFNNPKVSLDSLKQLYPYSKFVDFDKNFKSSTLHKKKKKSWLAPFSIFNNDNNGSLGWLALGIMMICIAIGTAIFVSGKKKLVLQPVKV